MRISAFRISIQTKLSKDSSTTTSCSQQEVPSWVLGHGRHKGTRRNPLQCEMRISGKLRKQLQKVNFQEVSSRIATNN